MKIITLTSDFGTSDYYVAALKGAIYRQEPSATVVDISHNIRPFDSGHAAYVLKNCFHEFPNNTVHLIAVDTEPIVSEQGFPLVLPCILFFKNQFFIANDNGFFGHFLGDEKEFEIFKLDGALSNPHLLKFPSKNLYLPAAVKLLNGEKLNNIASESIKPRTAFFPTPFFEENGILGEIVYIDSFGNVITNITTTLFEQVGKNNPFTLYFKLKGAYYIDKIQKSYNEVDQGERLAIFNERGNLEIAINRGANSGLGGADRLLGLRLGDKVRIDFTPKGSMNTLDQLMNLE